MTRQEKSKSKSKSLLALPTAALLCAIGCTTLGPMPATTGVSAVPAGRPGGEVGAALVPGYYLSSGTQPSPGGATLNQSSVLIEPDRLIKLPGVVVGARHVGDDQNGGYFEPLVGYRCHLDDAQRVSAAAVGYFIKASGHQDGASFAAKRGGGEIAFDVRFTPPTSIIELHGSAGAALTGLSVTGEYCLDPTGQFGATCSPSSVVTPVSASGVFPSATAGLSLDFARHRPSFFHGGRLALLFSGGTMPTAIAGRQRDAHWYSAAGAALSFGFGSAR